MGKVAIDYTCASQFNFIVHDLEQAVTRYQKLLGFEDFKFDLLEKRGVSTARIKLGQTWLILVQPTDLPEHVFFGAQLQLTQELNI